MRITVALCGAAVLFVIACSSHSSHHSRCCESSPGVVFQGTPAIPPPPPPPPDSGMPPVAPAGGGRVFATPQEAIQAVAVVAGKHDRAALEELFGPGATEVLWSGDETSDVEDGLKVKSLIEAKVSFDEITEAQVVAELGKEEWPFPVPLVKTGSGWKFDLEKGKDELLSRRIGRNELETIETLYEYVEAQKEYMAKGRDGNPPAYAQKVKSSDGKHDGLYWETAEGEEPSPFGPLVAEARKSGYTSGDDEPQPFEGYYYRILTGQGSHVSGASKSYVDGKGLMTRGYAAVAWPAKYGNSGIMTFLINQSGILFEKDLGKDTEKIAAAMSVYDPDSTWRPSPRKPEIDDDE